MKNLITILLLTSIIGCSPFVNKELRQKNKCNRKLEKVERTCPELVHSIDTILVPFNVEVPKIEIKDSIILKVDTLKLEKLVPYTKIKEVIKTFSIDTLILDSLYRLKIRLSDGVLSYDIEIYQRNIKEAVKVPVKRFTPIHLTIWEKALNWFDKWYTIILWILIPIILIILLFRYGKRFLHL